MRFSFIIKAISCIALLVMTSVQAPAIQPTEKFSIKPDTQEIHLQ